MASQYNINDDNNKPITHIPVPGGAVRLDDNFYVARIADEELKRQITQSGEITTIRGPRQTGKTSLLIRGIAHEREAGTKIVHLDMQRVDSMQWETLDKFLYYLASVVFTRSLELKPKYAKKMWENSFGPQDKLTFFLEDYVLKDSQQRILLAMDEIDHLIDSDFSNNFFSMIRAWRNSAALGGLWSKINIIMAISTEPYLLITDTNQSPFNIGLTINLKDFTVAQVEKLNDLHDNPLKTDDELKEFMNLLSGHPFLTRLALYKLATEDMNWSQFRKIAALDNGPFNPHLRKQLKLLQDKPPLQKALKQIIEVSNCDNKAHRYQLLRAGLIQGFGEVFEFRCELYKRYLDERLGLS